MIIIIIIINVYTGIMKKKTKNKTKRDISQESIAKSVKSSDLKLI